LRLAIVIPYNQIENGAEQWGVDCNKSRKKFKDPSSKIQRSLKKQDPSGDNAPLGRFAVSCFSLELGSWMLDVAAT